MTTAEIEEKITGIFEEAIRQKTVNGVSYALVDQGGVSRHYLGQAELGQFYDLASLTKWWGRPAGFLRKWLQGKSA